MKKTSVRIVTMLLACIMLLSTVACSDKEAEESTSESNVEEISTDGAEDTEIKPNFSGNTYDLSDFNILTRKHLATQALAVESLSAKSSILEKAIYDRNKTVEEQFQVKLRFLISDDSGIRDSVAANALADVDVYDLVGMHGRTLMGGVLAGYYLDWNDMPTINLDAPWWSQGYKNDLKTPGGKVFIMNGDMDYGYWGGTGGMYFNKDILEEGHITSPYDLVEQDNWTFETFYQVARQAAASMDGEGATGYVVQKYRCKAYCFVGANVLELQNDGKYTIGIKSDRAYTAQDEFMTFVIESGVCTYEEDLQAARNMFKNGMAAFFNDNTYTVSEFADMNFGFVPFPKYDNNCDYTFGVGSGATSYAIVTNTSEENRARIGDVVEGLAYYGYKMVTPIYIDTFLSYQKMKDDSAVATLNLIRENVQMDLADYLNPGGIGDVGTLMIDKPDEYPSLATTIEKLSSKGQVESALSLWYALDYTE